MKTLFLLQGVPGSGKSTIAYGLARGMNVPNEIFSTDTYWYQRYGAADKNGVYLFEAGLLGEAHAWNQNRCDGAMKLEIPLIIIDNTNIKKSAAQPYLDMAEKYGYEVQVVRVSCPVEVAIERNAQRTEDRRVPENLIRAWHEEMEDLV